ncbi:MAG TPA: phosphodiester glycosidase family protein [Trebonia sp.]
MPRGGPGPEWPSEPDDGQAYGDRGTQRDRGAQRDGYGYGGYDGKGRSPADQEQYQYGQYRGPGYGAPGGYGQPQSFGGQGGNGYGQPGYAPPGYRPGPGQGYDQPTQTFTYRGAGNGYQGNGGPRGYNGYQGNGYQGNGDPRAYSGDPWERNGGRARGNMRQYAGPRRSDDRRYQMPGQGPGGPALDGRPSPDALPARRVRFRRTRRLFRLRSVRIVSAVLALFLVWLTFSVGQAAFKNNGQSVAANVAEWARDHHLGPIVTFGEWVSYNPPPKGGKPSFSLAVPSGEAVTPSKAPTGKAKKTFVPNIPATLKSLAGSPIAGEGQWRVVEQVNGEPAILTTFLRDATYTSQVNGIASIDQRLVKFSLRPGSEDPGPADWGVSNYIPAGQRKGLLATFNGGFKLDSAGGGFYLNGIHHGSLVKGTAAIVYYKDGTIKIGEWGRDFTMNSSIEGVRQNLKLLVDRGKLAADANSNVMSNWGATLGGGYYVWRSGIGITKDGRIVYVYGPALNAQDLGELLQRAGAVEGMQMDINPAWMKFDYYQAKGKPSDPTPVPLLPTQQPSPYSYYTPSTRDFTAVYSR